ncbi:MAG: antibiotic biosynthesis monooxygenase family protein [Pseudomonadales bacterium]
MIKVLIEREIAEGMSEYYDRTVRRVIQTVNAAPGCLGGESLKETQNTHRRIVWSKWNNISDWQTWYASDERRRVLSEITPLLVGSERITVLEAMH